MATKAEKPDTRNLEWRNNNVGSTLLQKMGWKQGQALGSKHRKRESVEEVSGEGLKIMKRRDGLGLGGEEVAKNEESTSHASFSQLLESLKQQHPSSADGSSSNKKKRKKSGSGSDDGKSSKSKKKKSSSKKETVFASNKITNSRVRQSKFTTKSAEDMACIFGGEFSSAQIIATHQQNTISRAEKKAKKERKKEKKRNKKEENDNNKDSITEEGSSDDVDKQERKRKRKEEKKKRKKKEDKARDEE